MNNKKRMAEEEGTERGKPGGNLFGRTQSRLTLAYSSLTIVLLALFIGVVYLLLSYIVISGQKDNLLSLVAVERIMVENNMQKGKPEDTLDNQRLWGSGSEQFFYYVINDKGELISGNEIFPGMRPELLGLVQDWKPRAKEIMEVSLSVPADVLDNGEAGAKPVAPSTLHLMVTGQAALTKNGPDLTLYAGINVTPQYNLLHRLLMLLILLAIVFVFIACLIGWLMSRKAMVPIVKSYNRQREFVGNASHELRTPLSVLLASVNVLELELGQSAPSFAKHTLSNMKDEIRRMTRMVQDLLVLARSDSDDLELVKRDFDFRPLAEKTIQSIRHLKSAKGVCIELIGPEQLVLNGDPEKLRQVLTILLDNAVKFTPRGGEVRVVISDRDETGSPGFHLSVEDTGPGIRAGDVDRIFDRFYRGDKSRTRGLGGHGLGLAIAKWIVEAHHGQITLSSEESKGSIFHVDIPVNK
ncbi:sensor histidine kinase [Paenibacillus kribbensis]|uniref:sensor histidine kinase n=1 Tax=Paenibacillus kribbensis TaxID=172713 RepID=UPI0015B9D469|nr:HAMP domain-containing sensor histidine kinase [Paenibacillus kribbensis]